MQSIIENANICMQLALLAAVIYGCGGMLDRILTLLRLGYIKTGPLVSMTLGSAFLGYVTCPDAAPAGIAAASAFTLGTCAAGIHMVVGGYKRLAWERANQKALNDMRSRANESIGKQQQDRSKVD